jgi:hypothetical protein
VATQKFETFRIWKSRRKEVINAINLGAQDILKVRRISDDVAGLVARELNRQQIYEWQVRKYLSEYFRRKGEEGAGRIHRGDRRGLMS